MNLLKKKQLAARTLKVGKERIVFVKSRLDDIKEAITKQDIRDLIADKAIFVKEIKGRKKIKKKIRKSTGNIRKKIKTRKQDYVKITRKLRNYISELKKQGQLSQEEVRDIRKKIKNKDFRSKTNLKEYVGELKK
jgi:large subunit ribosomal protein L19e